MSVSNLQELHNARNSSADFLSFHAFWTEMQPQLFHTSTAADRSLSEGRFLSAAVPIELALTRGGAAMFTRSTPSCGILDGPSLAWAASPGPKLRKSAGSLGLRLTNGRGQISGLVIVYTWYIPGIYMVYPV
jgi:hypothetical protein